LKQERALNSAQTTLTTTTTTTTLSPHVKESKRVVDSGFHTVDSGFRRLGAGFHAFGFRIPNFLRFRIPKFLTLVFFRGQYFAL